MIFLIKQGEQSCLQKRKIMAGKLSLNGWLRPGLLLHLIFASLRLMSPRVCGQRESQKDRCHCQPEGDSVRVVQSLQEVQREQATQDLPGRSSGRNCLRHPLLRKSLNQMDELLTECAGRLAQSVARRLLIGSDLVRHNRS